MAEFSGISEMIGKKIGACHWQMGVDFKERGFYPPLYSDEPLVLPPAAEGIPQPRKFMEPNDLVLVAAHFPAYRP